MPAVKPLIAIAAAAATAVVGGVVGVSLLGPQMATVKSVTDGDTIVVTLDTGGEERVRFLNVNAPELHGEQPETCLGQEAKEFTESVLPAGIRVELKTDREKRDRYGRLLAGVYVGSDFVNEDLARAGLGVPMTIEPNTKFRAAIEAANADAKTSKAGIYADSVECTPQAFAQAQSAALTQLTTAAIATGTTSETIAAVDARRADVNAIIKAIAAYRAAYSAVNSAESFSGSSQSGV